MITRHPITPHDQAAMLAMRETVAGAKGNIGPEARALFDEIMEHTPPVAGVEYVQALVGGVPGWWCHPVNAADNQAILYLHGGAYQVGSAKSYRNFVSQITAASGRAAFVPDYRLAPENPFPAAVADAKVAYQGLIDAGYSSIALAGDSAGGGLALVLLAQVVAGKQLAPVGVVVMSPWVDLALAGETIVSLADVDPLLTKASLHEAAQRYLGQHDRRDPLASPLYGDLAGLPPALIHTGEAEILLDDSRRYYAKLVEAGGEGDLHTWEGMPHVFPASIGVLDASSLALESIGSFLHQAFSTHEGANV